MTTLKDLSRHLGLSITQVSRALNGYPDVSDNTRSRVSAAAKDLNYTPNIAARRLVSGRSGVVGFIARNVENAANNMIFFETVIGLSSAFSARDMQFVLHLTPVTDCGDIVPVYDRLFRGGTLDGFVLVDPVPDDVRADHLLAARIPFVMHGRCAPEPGYAYVDIDNFGLAHRLASHLTALGHRRIALIAGEAHLAHVQSREAGLSEAVTATGASFDRSLIRHGAMTESLGLTAAVQLFSGPAPAPTAVICGNVLIAKGVYAALNALSLRIPKDVSVVAHDDVVEPLQTESFAPSLTVTRSALSESWGPIADFLVGAIEGAPPSELRRILPFEFIERNSSGPAPL
jgi:LacI family transcriptional regulator